MSENFSIKTEPFANDYEHEIFNNDRNTLSGNITKLEHFTNLGNDIKEEKLDLDTMEEHFPENVDKSITDKIKNEDVDEMDELLAENSHSKEDVDKMDEFVTEVSSSSYSLSSSTWKSDDRTEVITQQISLPKLEIMDVHEDEQNGSCSGLEVHTTRLHQVHSTDKPTEHKCEICGCCYNESLSLRTHIRHKHPLSIDSDYICAICNQKFTTQIGFDRHTERVHLVAVTPTIHKCEICGTCFKEVCHLRKHISNEHPSSIGSEYMCEICNQRFTTQTGLNMHSDRTHPETQTPADHKCEICGSCYGTPSALRAHIRNKHPSSIYSKYICKICNQKFVTQRGLTRHSYWTHSETQPPAEYKCKICGTCYTQSRYLEAHIRKKHPSSIDADYVCETCHKRFATQCDLERHCKKMH
ncbi:uncharacterized protein isoform X2 [Musca autumnalis]|uniref:uncharacterized protein isoform X2 n=1 Tax=Musca autumnalis TaxID=221902 RepID=UPI003CED52CE